MWRLHRPHGHKATPPLRVVETSTLDQAGSLAVIHSVCRHSTYVRSLESATPVLCDVTSTCPIDQNRCRAGSAASAVQKRNANSVSDAKQAAPARGQGGPQAKRMAFEGDTPSAASHHAILFNFGRKRDRIHLFRFTEHELPLVPENQRDGGV